MAHPRHEEVRQRYGGRCGYCGVAEQESGGELSIDHHQPVSAGGDDTDANLIYCCFRCNFYKGDFFPTADDLRQGFRILHPLHDDVVPHLRENPATGRVEPLTETGRFHAKLLHLNRPQLVELRLTRRLHSLLAESCQLLRDENESLRNQVLMLEQCVQELRRLQ